MAPAADRKNHELFTIYYSYNPFSLTFTASQTVKQRREIYRLRTGLAARLSACDTVPNFGSRSPVSRIPF